MTQRRAQIVRDGITERFQLGGTLGDTLLQIRVETMNFILRALALRNVTNVALNHLPITRLIDVADELYGNVAVIHRFQRQVFIPDITVFLKSLEHRLIGLNVLKGT